MYYLADGPEREPSLRKSLYSFPKTQSCLPILYKNGEIFPPTKWNFRQQNNSSITKLSICKSKSGEKFQLRLFTALRADHMKTRSGRLAMVVSLVDENGPSFKAFTASCLANDLRGFGWCEEWFIKSLGKLSNSRGPDQSYYHYEIMGLIS